MAPVTGNARQGSVGRNRKAEVAEISTEARAAAENGEPNRLARVAVVGAVVAAAALVAIVLFGSDRGYSVTARFLNAGQLVSGNQVQIGGVPAGSVKDIRVTPNGQADVELELEERYAPLHKGARAVIKQRSLSGIANRFVDIEQGPGTAEEIDDGGQLGVDDTRTAVELDQLFELFDPPTRVSVQEFLEGSREMIEGKGQELNRGIKYLNPALSTSRRLFGELTKDEALLERFLVDSSELVSALAERRADLTGVVRNLNATFGALGSQKDALAESIERLPPFMRRANTTFVNLRAALEDLDPLVEASKPVARRLDPFLREARGLAADAEPTIRDLSRTIRRAGGGNDLIEFVRTFPPLARTALDRRQLNGAERDGAFPETERALRGATPTIAFGRPYTNDFLGWFDDFSTSGAYDALGAFSRAGLSLAESVFSLGGATPGGAGPVKGGQFRRCPGGADTVAPDGSNLLPAEEQQRLNCTEQHRAPGPPQ